MNNDIDKPQMKDRLPNPADLLDAPGLSVAQEAERCQGRYPVSNPRDEPFDVNYRCALAAGHAGPCGRGENSEPAVPPPALPTENMQGPAAHVFVDTPLKRAVRKAFDYPSITNIEAVAAAAASPALLALQQENEQLVTQAANWKLGWAIAEGDAKKLHAALLALVKALESELAEAKERLNASE